MTSIDGGEVRLRVLVENGASGLARSGSQFEDGGRVASGGCHGCFLEVVVARYGLAHHRQVAVQREVVVVQGTASLTKAGENLRRRRRLTAGLRLPAARERVERHREEQDAARGDEDDAGGEAEDVEAVRDRRDDGRAEHGAAHEAAPAEEARAA